MNRADSRKIAELLEKQGHKPVAKINEADLILINMCSVRQSAVDRVFGTRLKLKELGAHPKKLILTGCVLKKDEKILKETFDEIWDRKKYLKITAKPKKEPGFISISNGCNNFCTYCVVPYTRGQLICRPHKAILKDVKNLIKNGSQEIWLLGQNVNDYHSPNDRSINFAKLLKMASNIPGTFSIRFMSPHPKNFTDELIKTMAQSQKIAKYINLPIQSGDNEILKNMNRKYTREQYKNLVKKIRRAVPEINLSTDVIVGFPGETKKQFANTVKLFKEINFDIAYISKYSSRPGTSASKLKDNISIEEKKRRAKILMSLVKHPST